MHSCVQLSGVTTRRPRGKVGKGIGEFNFQFTACVQYGNVSTMEKTAVQTWSQSTRVDDIHRRACVASRPEVDPTLRVAAILVVVRVHTMSPRERTRNAL